MNAPIHVYLASTGHNWAFSIKFPSKEVTIVSGPQTGFPELIQALRTKIQPTIKYVTFIFNKDQFRNLDKEEVSKALDYLTISWLVEPSHKEIYLLEQKLDRVAA